MVENNNYLDSKELVSEETMFFDELVLCKNEECYLLVLKKYQNYIKYLWQPDAIISNYLDNFSCDRSNFTKLFDYVNINMICGERTTWNGDLTVSIYISIYILLYLFQFKEINIIRY